MSRARSRSWLIRIAAAIVLALGLAGAATATNAAPPQSSRLEYAVKATFIYKLAAFVEWPPSAFQTPTSPIAMCVVGANPFGVLLHQATAGQRIEARPIVVRRVSASDRAAGCHVLYVGADSASAARALRSVRGEPVLTVTDSSFEDDAKGIIHFVLRDNRVRFEVDTGAAAQNGVAISSKLKSLAVASHTAS